MDVLRSLRVLLTGASGFLGRYLLKDFPQKAQILAQYFQHPIHSTGDEFQSLELDLTKSSFDKLAEFKPDVIIHTAAQSSIDKCEREQGQAWRINFEASEKLVDFAKEMNSRFIYTSTDIVFDGKKGNYAEKDIPNPINVYGQTKLESEKYILENLKNSVVARLALFYGKALNGTPSFTEVMLENLRASKRVNAFTDQYRSPLPVSQLALAIWELADSDFCGVIHIGGSERISRYDMAKILCEQFNLPLELVNPVLSPEVNLIAFRPLDCSLDISLAGSLLKTQLISFVDGLKFSFRK